MAPEVRITRRETVPGRPFSEVFITSRGQSFYSRLWHVLDDTPLNRAHQAEQFARRQMQEMI